MFRVRTFSWVNLAKYLRYCRTYGFASATRLAFQRMARGGELPGVVEPLALPPLPADDSDRDVMPIKKRISVIIPTRNVGPEFGFLLRKLRVQKAIEQIEIIVVDSGSSDDTVEVADSAGALVVRIPSESFTHSYSRNCGAARATGDYLLFIVQDALPLTDRWLWELARVLETSNVVGVSCAEYPREDSDLFYQLLIWNHYRSLRLDRDRIMQWDSSCTSCDGLRANAQLSGISFLIRRDAFEKYRYAGDYAEDLELGIRLIRDGHKIAFLYSTRVLHSHNRPAFYFLKRGYVDVKNLARVMPGFTCPEIRDEARVFEDMATLYGRLTSLPLELANRAGRVCVAEYMTNLRRVIGSSNGSQHAQSADPTLDQFISSRAPSQAVYKPRTNMIVPHVMQHLDLLEQFLSRIEEDVDEPLATAIQECLIKIFALHSGTHLGYLYLSQSSAAPPLSSIKQLDRELVLGV
jgi:O-antigen biosynthesis protein